MKKHRCRLCGEWFLTDDPSLHTCGCENDMEDELADPALKARIEEGVRKRLEEL